MSKNNHFTDSTELSAEDEVLAEEALGAKEKENVGGYRFASVLFLLLAVGGLFIGLLSKWISVFTPLVTVDGALGNSLLGVMIALTKDIFSGGNSVSLGLPRLWYATSWYGSIADVVQIVFIVLLILAVLVPLALTIAGFCSPKFAKSAMYLNGLLVFFAYLGYFALLFSARVFNGKTAWRDLIDLPSLTIAGAALLVLFVAALIRKKGIAIVNFIQLALVFATMFACLHPQSPLHNDYMKLFVGGQTGMAFVVQILLIALTALVVINAVVSTIRLTATKAFVFDVIRYFLMAGAAIALLCLYVFKPATGDAPAWSVLVKLPAILLLAAPLAAFLIALVCSIVKAVSKKKAEKTETAEAAEESDDLLDLMSEPETESVAEESVVAEEPVAEPVAEPVVAEEKPAAVQEPVATPAPVYAAPAPVYAPAPIYAAPAAAPAPVVIQLAPAPAPVATVAAEEKVVAQEKPVVAPAPVAEETPMNEFELSMMEIAKGHAPAQTPVAEQCAAPATPAKSAPAAAAPVSNAYESYTYDAFFNTLTTQEKSEFGDLFISNKYGTHTYLPRYVVGGDNELFFKKVFIYLGRFRAYASGSLVEKLYRYVNAK